MGIMKTTIYVCDRCHKQASFQGDASLPPGWEQIGLGASTPGDLDLQALILWCKECFTAFEIWRNANSTE